MQRTYSLDKGLALADILRWSANLPLLRWFLVQRIWLGKNYNMIMRFGGNVVVCKEIVAFEGKLCFCFCFVFVHKNTYQIVEKLSSFERNKHFFPQPWQRICIILASSRGNDIFCLILSWLTSVLVSAHCLCAFVHALLVSLKRQAVCFILDSLSAQICT